MAYEQKPGTGSLFKNTYKTDGDNKPDWKGSIVAHRNIKMGERLELASWKKDGGKGPFMSLKMQDSKPKDAEPNEQRGGNAAPPDDSEIPF